MFKYLMDREKEELFRTSTRQLTFPDGSTRDVTAYRLVWGWWDRALAYEFGPDQDELLTWTLKCMETEKLDDEGEALGQVLDYIIYADEVEEGADYTDDPLVLTLARQHMDAFQKRKAARQVGQGNGPGKKPSTPDSSSEEAA